MSGKQIQSRRPIGAGAPLLMIVTALARAGWGPELATRDLGAFRTILFQLGVSLDPTSGTGLLTVEQLAARAGVSERWTRSRLQIMEELQLLEWHRGGIKDGAPVPSWFRLDKKRLCILLALARETRDEALEEIRAKFRARLATLRLKTQWFRGKKGQNRRSSHPELSSSLPLPGTGPWPDQAPPAALHPPEPAGPPTEGDYAARVAALRARLRPLRT